MREKTTSSEASQWPNTHWLRRLVLLWLFPWRAHRLITKDGQVYVVRDGEFREREIQTPFTREWTPESEVPFSSIPYFEDYHREAYFAAKPFQENLYYSLLLSCIFCNESYI